MHRELTPDDDDEVLGGVGAVRVLDDVHPFVLLQHVLQHQVARGAEAGPGVHHLARLQQNHLSGAVGPGFEHDLTKVPRRDVDVNLLPKEGCQAFLFNWWNCLIRYDREPSFSY